ncbi:hypothetical protein HZH68_008817 [Vespula germanica]|uniref:Uncharacterized protein n=1 Tax=Vespula germanica TaxID=30212 RepID=A0A834N6J1_VESGE|nr:hypothetical protein HZH68_008817 [Vespula germanica]
MVETLVYETPVQEEPEINHFLDHNGRLPPPMIPVPDTELSPEVIRQRLMQLSQGGSSSMEIRDTDVTVNVDQRLRLVSMLNSIEDCENVRDISDTLQRFL